ncbi:MAG TPA: ribose-phosphate diphosphokinase [Candidatus Margulisiibacteriota bacterium]|nr:ribose-phosphate diphosphokinase [Candidatus Margulisiibacteriota bacterium]
MPTRDQSSFPRLRLHSFSDSTALGQALAQQLHLDCCAIQVHRFPDGESLIRVRPPAGTHAVVVRSLGNPNAKLLESVLAADALRRAGASRVTLVAPYLPYMRQDMVFTPGEPISQRVIGAWLGSSFDAVLTVEAHLHRVRTLAAVVAPGQARSLSAAPLLADWLQRQRPPAGLIVGPDTESRPWIEAIARRVQVPWVVCHKRRLGDRSVRIELPVPLPHRRAVIFDDIASSGATLAAVARALRTAGATAVDAVVVHAIFRRGALARIRRAGVNRIISCDTIAHQTNAIFTAAVLARALRRLRF